MQTGLKLGTTYEGQLIDRPYLSVANVQDGHLNLADVTTINSERGTGEHVVRALEVWSKALILVSSQALNHVLIGGTR